jgi:ribonuclease BN (tRNA processing enzyme)
MNVAVELTVLGAGTILPRAGYGCAGHALRPAPGARVTLFVCGPGTIRSLAGAGIGLHEIERVVVSHFHADHCLDLYALAFARNNPTLKPLPPLELVGPAGLAELLAKASTPPGRWLKDPAWTVTEVAPDARGRARLERDGAVLSCASNGHTPEALSWRLDLAGGPSFAYSGDTPPSRAVAELARDADLFLLECSHPDGQASEGHLTPTSAAELARDARCRRLVLTHFYPGLEPEDAREVAGRTFPGPIELARDGARFELRG